MSAESQPTPRDQAAFDKDFNDIISGTDWSKREQKFFNSGNERIDVLKTETPNDNTSDKLFAYLESFGGPSWPEDSPAVRDEKDTGFEVLARLREFAKRHESEDGENGSISNKKLTSLDKTGKYIVSQFPYPGDIRRQYLQYVNETIKTQRENGLPEELIPDLNKNTAALDAALGIIYGDRFKAYKDLTEKRRASKSAKTEPEMPVSNKTLDATPDIHDTNELSVDTKTTPEQELITAQEADRALLSRSQELHVAILDWGRKVVDKIDSFSSANNDPLSKTWAGRRLAAYNRAKEAYIAKKARADNATSATTQWLHERRATRAATKLSKKRAALKKSIHPLNEASVSLKERAANRQSHVNSVTQQYVDLNAKAAARKVVNQQLRQEKFSRRERKAALEKLAESPRAQETARRAGRVLIEHALHERNATITEKVQHRLEKRSDNLHNAKQKAERKMESLGQAIHETDRLVVELEQTSIPEARDELGRWLKVHREATVNDNIEEINRNIASAREHINQLEKDLSARKQHRVRLERTLSSTEKKHQSILELLSASEQITADHALNVTTPINQGRATHKVRRDMAVDEIIGIKR